MSDKSLMMISEVVTACPLEELHLRYNRIKVKGGNQLAQAIEMSKSLQILDLAFNSLGSSSDNKKIDKKKPGPKTPKKRKKKDLNEIGKAAQSWSRCFENNESLLHVDISFNALPWDDFFEVVAVGLAENHTCLGLHVKGNQAKVDSMGYLHPIDEFSYLATDHVPRNPVTKYQYMEPPPAALKQKKAQEEMLAESKLVQEVHENCWICGKWTEIEFQFTPGVSHAS